MKKLYVFAVSAAVCAMASCGGKSGAQATDAQAVEDQEQVNEETDVDDDNLTEATTFEADAFSITIPAGWWVSNHDETDVNAMLPCETGNCKNVHAMVSKSFTIDESIESSTFDGFVEQEPVTINGVEYRVVKKDENHMTIYRTPLAEGNLGVYCQNVDIEDEEVKAILESIVLK